MPIWLGTTGIILISLLVGCDRQEPIRQYLAPAEPAPTATTSPATPIPLPPPATQPSPAMADAKADAMAMSPDAITLPPAADWSTEHWTAPADWIATPNPPLPRLGHFRIGPTSAPADLVITRFPGDVGGLLANVNRWRQQLGLPPVADLKEQSITTLTSPAKHTITLVDLVSSSKDRHEATRVYVGIITTPDQHTWFLKLTGPDATVTPQRQNVIQFLQAFRPSASATVHPPTTPHP